MKNASVFGDYLVLELASVLAGPAVGMFFAEMGSRVIKVENPRAGGDVTRSWRTPSEEGRSPGAYFSCVNWGKQSIGVDLCTAEGRGVVQDLARLADVVLVSYKAGDALQLGVDWGTLSEINPRLVYAEVTAYGAGDARVGYDAVIQAETGFTSMNGTCDSGPLKMPVALMDLLAGHQLKEGILAALLERERTGRGRRVSVSLFAAGITALANQAANWLMTGTVPERLGSAHPNIVPYGSSFRCRDGGFVVLAVGTDRQFFRLCRCLGREALASDPRFATNEMRVLHREELERRLSELIGREDRDVLAARLRSEGVPSGSVRDVREALSDPLSTPLILAHATGASAVRTLAFDGPEETQFRLAPPPALSEHAGHVLSAVLGYDDRRIERLVRKKAVAISSREDSNG